MNRQHITENNGSRNFIPLDIRLVFLSIGLLTLTVLPHLNHLRLEIIGIFIFFAGWRCIAERWRWIPRNRWVIYLFAIIGFSVTAWNYGAPLGRDPGVAFLVVMVGLKSIEISSLRDIRIILLLGLFVVMTHFLYADGINWALALFGLVVAITWLMTQLEHATPGRYLLSDLRLVLKMLVQALPFVFILFYLFPRLAGSVFLFQSESQSGITGLSDSLTMGTVSNLIQSDDIAFTASFFDWEVPGPEQRYWRGSVLWVTDGRQWIRNESASFLKKSPITTTDQQTLPRYEIALEPNTQEWLFSLDYPANIPKSAIMDIDHHLYIKGKTDGPFRYTLSSDRASAFEITPITEGARAQALDLGNTIVTPRLKQLIRSLKTGTETPIQFAENVFRHFNQNEFIYTLQPPILKTNAPVDEFLFESQRGFCGHYASSFATIMRSGGVPARLVVGYLGGKYNPRSNQIVVHQSDAHAWVEIWQQGIGWIRMDPTAAIAPERIQYSIDFNSSINADGSVLFSIGEFKGFRRLMIELVWIKDSIKASWNRWFTTFDQSRQRELFKSLGLDHLDARLLSIGAFISALVMLSLVSFIVFYRDRVKPDKVVRIYGQFCRKLEKAGLKRLSSEGPVDFSHRAIEKFPKVRNQIIRITRQFVKLRYSISESAPDKPEISTFKKWVNRFNPS